MWGFFYLSGQKTNTNQCIVDLGGVRVCKDLNKLGIPRNLGACCGGFREMVKDQCECNPAIDVLLGEGGDRIYQLESLCRLAEPHNWTSIPLSDLRSCDSIKTHNYGCKQSDVEIDAGRLKNALTFLDMFAANANESSCFDTPSFLQNLETVVDEKIEFTVPYGVGKYKGYEEVAEYLGIAFSSLTHGFWQYNITVDLDKPNKLEVSEDGKRWYHGASFSGSFLRGLNHYNDKYSC